MNYITKKIKDEKGRVIKVLAQYKNSEVVFIRDGDAFRELKIGKRKWLPPDVNKFIIKQARGIFGLPFVGSTARKYALPSLNKIHTDAKKLYAWTYYVSLRSNGTWTECNFIAHKAEIQSRLATQAYGQEKFWLRDLRSAGVRILNEGWLEASRWENGSLVWQKVPDIDTALRMQEHILDGYLKDGQADTGKMMKDHSIGEIASINSIEEVVATANNTLADWQGADANKEFLSNRLTWAALQLVDCRNESKTAARHQIYKSAGLKDETDRFNPAAMAARTIAAIGRLSSRLAELRILAPYIAMRRSILLLEKRRLEKNLERAASVALLLARSWSKVSTTDTKNASKSILKNIDWALSYLGSIWLSPYYERAQQAEYFLTIARERILKNNFVQAQGYFLDIHKILTDSRL